MKQLLPILLIALLFSCKKSSTELPGPGINPLPTSFTPKDSIVDSNFFQVEFSSDSKSMVWCERPSAQTANIWYANMKLVTGLPDLNTKLLV
ncbi:MAG: hypothetical protein H7Y86_10000 [Rhizobacter sp.]|nr:hypothetical protein [Ferruginibacter sp.]